MRHDIIAQINIECPWRDTLYWYDTIDSTNTRAKLLAKEYAPHGTVLIAGTQTAGRGRMGRSFSSPQQMGVYLSVILRPQCPPADLMHLTCAAAVAGCKAVETVSGLCPNIKWTNDLVYGKKKLGGILTELSLDSRTGLVDYAIVGIGINCNQRRQDFPTELQDMATSLRELTNTPCAPEKLSAALVEALYQMDQMLLSQKTAIMDYYRSRCMTLDQDIMVLRGDEVRYGTAIGLDDDGGLIVCFTDGSVQTVSSGEVSVRGMYGYM